MALKKIIVTGTNNHWRAITMYRNLLASAGLGGISESEIIDEITKPNIARLSKSRTIIGKLNESDEL